MEMPPRNRPSPRPGEQPEPPPAPGWERGAAMVICLAAAVALAWLALRYAWGIFAPFVLALLLSRLTAPPVEALCRKTSLPRPLCAAGLVIVTVGGAAALTVSGVRRGLDELTRLLARLNTDTGGLGAMLEAALAKANSISAHIPLLRRFENTPGYAAFCERLDSLMAGALERLTERLSAALPAAAMALAEWVPAALIFVTVTLLACYYFTADDGRIRSALQKGLLRLTPPPLRDSLPPLGRRLRRLFRSYVRAYLLLGLLTFLQCFIGLALLGVPYAFILAIAIALVDTLPLLGTGVVLIPWAVICLLLGNLRLGLGLLVLYAVVSIIRQVLEPKLVGDGLGIHPLLSLAATYAGWRLFGVWGMILAPLVAAVGLSLWEK